MPRDASKLERRLQRLLHLLVGLLVVSVAALGWSLYHNLYDNGGGEYAPLRPYGTQTVMNTQRFVLPSDPVLHIRAVKCLAAGVDEPVKVFGKTQWLLVVPPGTSVPGNESTGVRYPANVETPRVNGYRPPTADKSGCIRVEYANPLPDAVLASAAKVCQATGLPSLWKYTGTETPEDANGRRGLTRTWETEPFRVGCQA